MTTDNRDSTPSRTPEEADRLIEAMRRGRLLDYESFQSIIEDALRYVEAGDGHGRIVLRDALVWLNKDFPQVASRSANALRGRLRRTEMALAWKDSISLDELLRAYEAAESEDPTLQQRMVEFADRLKYPGIATTKNGSYSPDSDPSHWTGKYHGPGVTCTPHSVCPGCG